MRFDKFEDDTFLRCFYGNRTPAPVSFSLLFSCTQSVLSVAFCAPFQILQIQLFIQTVSKLKNKKNKNKKSIKTERPLTFTHAHLLTQTQVSSAV